MYASTKVRKHLLLTFADMRIAVNTRFLMPGKMEGIGHFTQETLQRIVKAHPEHQFHFIFDRPFSNNLLFESNVTGEIASPPARHPFLWYYWFQFALPKAVKNFKADVLLSPDGYAPLGMSIPTVCVIHDLAFEYYPKHINGLARWYYKRYTPLFAAESKRLVTVSEFSKQSIIEKYGTNADKIDVVFGAASEVFQKMEQEQVQKIRQQYSLGEPYFIFVGALHPRKNIAMMLKAYDHFKGKTAENVKMLIVGRKAWMTSEMEEVLSAMKAKSEVIFTDYLPHEEASKLIAASLALVFVSKFEGFGLPILEGMHCEVPVINSNTSSMPEVAGDATLQVDPENMEEISAAMQRLASEPELRTELVNKGRLQREKFSWDKTAELLWASVEKALKT